MLMQSLRQIRSFVAVFEEGSFTAAAEREGATQSGMSQHVRQLEQGLGAQLFSRDGRLVAPTAVGRRYYGECVAILRRLDEAGHAVSAIARSGGEVKVGLMPTFTRAVLSPTLKAFMAQAPGAEVRILEAYSAVLTEKVRQGELDFAIVPAFEGDVGLTTTRILSDREMLVAARGRAGRHLSPVRLSALGPIDIVLPGPQNTRRRNIETYLATNGVEVRSRLELDAMMGTLEFVAASEWVAILPGVIMAGDLDGARYDIRPLDEPKLSAEFVLIEPARKALAPAARLFADLLTAESARIAGILPR
jgi:DNA-binding transcriptional LysR family regulator